MGLFDLLKGKRKTSTINNAKQIVTQKANYGVVTANKVEVTPENFSSISENYIGFDVETTGLSPDYDVIIEVAAVRFANKRIVQTYCSLVNEGRPVPDSAYRINHISTEMLIQYGKQPPIVYQELVNFMRDVLEGHTCICAHNASFDIAFLCRALERLGFSGNIKYIDTLSLSRKTIKGLSNYKLETVANYFDLYNSNSHRAAADAEVCGKILSNLLSIKKGEVEKEREKERLRIEKSTPTDEEKEVFAIIANAMENNGSSIHNLRTYRNSSNYVLLLDVYTILRFKLTKKKSYVVIPKSYADGLQKTECCTATEGTENIRLLFDDPFELYNYGRLFSRVFEDMKNSQGIYMNEYEARFLSQTDLIGFKDYELSELLERAKNRQKLLAEQRELARLREKAQADLMQAKKEERELAKQKKEESKQRREAARAEQQALMKKMLEESNEFSKEMIERAARLSADCGKRAVLQLDDDYHVLNIYESVKEAASSAGIAPKTIRDVAQGKYKHGGGYCWSFADEFVCHKD